jgi:hypothetical protein
MVIGSSHPDPDARSMRAVGAGRDDASRDDAGEVAADAAGWASISVLETDANRRRGVRGGELAVRQGETVSVGRDADLRVGVEPPDLGVSRRALTLTASAAEWQIYIDNRAGAFVHPWAQAPIWAPAGTEVTQRWPKIGARLIGSDRSTEHWVLLESPDYTIPGYGSSQQPVAGPTHQPPVPKPLTRTQVEAVTAVFRQFLLWPPMSGPEPVPLAAAGARLGISATGVSERLLRVQDRAYALGLHQQTGVSDPSYVHLLVRHGYLTDPVARGDH